MMLEMCGARMLCAGLMKLIGMLSWPVAAFKFNERIMLDSRGFSSVGWREFERACTGLSRVMSRIMTKNSFCSVGKVFV